MNPWNSLLSLHQIHILLIIILITNIKSQSSRYYVDSENTNNGNIGDGRDWNNAFIRLSDALDFATQNGDEIWIKGSNLNGGLIYKPPQNTERDSCFFVNDGVSIYGGFQGNEQFIDQRPSDLTTYETIISGEIRDDISIIDNCYHVLTYNKSITINGITISDGYANEILNERADQLPTLLNGYGGAMITNNVLDQQNVLIQDVIFINNYAFNGGALWFGSQNDNVHVTIRGSKFINNAAIDGLYMFSDQH